MNCNVTFGSSAMFASFHLYFYFPSPMLKSAIQSMLMNTQSTFSTMLTASRSFSLFDLEILQNQWSFPSFQTIATCILDKAYLNIYSAIFLSLLIGAQVGVSLAFVIHESANPHIGKSLSNF